MLIDLAAMPERTEGIGGAVLCSLDDRVPPIVVGHVEVREQSEHCVVHRPRKGRTQRCVPGGFNDFVSSALIWDPRCARSERRYEARTMKD